MRWLGAGLRVRGRCRCWLYGDVSLGDGLGAYGGVWCTARYEGDYLVGGRHDFGGWGFGKMVFWCVSLCSDCDALYLLSTTLSCSSRLCRLSGQLAPPLQTAFSLFAQYLPFLELGG